MLISVTLMLHVKILMVPTNTYVIQDLLEMGRFVKVQFCCLHYSEMLSVLSI